jgi:hypothetical protein
LGTFRSAENLVHFIRLAEILSPRRRHVVVDWLLLRFGLLRDLRLAGYGNRRAILVRVLIWNHA